MRSPSRPPESNRLLTFAVLLVLGLLCWGVTAYVWYQAYLWFLWITPPTFIFTLLAIPIPFLAYKAFTGSSALPTNGASASSPSSSPPAATPAQASAVTGAATSDWLTWLGNGDSHRGTLVVLVFLFWSIMYWSMMALTAFTFASWGLLTIVGLIILRAFFRHPGREVPGAAEPKSKAK
jgi:hypothetical protein